MRRIGQVREAHSTGQIERVMVIGVGLLLVLLIQVTPIAGPRTAATTAPARPPAAVTPSSVLAPATAPLESTAPAPAEEPAPPAEGPRTPRADPANYRVVAGGSGANLRREPTTTAAVVQQLRDGAVVMNLDEQRAAGGITWRRVAEGNVDGWVSAELLVPER